MAATGTPTLTLTDVAVCQDCNSEVELVTDGARAYVVTTCVDDARLYTRDVPADRDIVWRSADDEGVLVAECPTVRMPSEEPCLAWIEFRPEHPVTDYFTRRQHLAHLIQSAAILTEAP